MGLWGVVALGALGTWTSTPCGLGDVSRSRRSVSR